MAGGDPQRVLDELRPQCSLAIAPLEEPGAEQRVGLAGPEIDGPDPGRFTVRSEERLSVQRERQAARLREGLAASAGEPSRMSSRPLPAKRAMVPCVRSITPI